MTERKKFTLLKLEGIIFAISIIFFTVMFYFGYLDKYMLCTMLLFFFAMLFSINASIQADRSSMRVSRFNIWLSIFLSMAGIAMGIYFYMSGLIVF